MRDPVKPSTEDTEKNKIPAQAADEKSDNAAGVSESPKDILEEALDMAQSVGDRRKAKGSFSGLGLTNFDDSVSLYEYIDEAEKKSKSLFDSPSWGDGRPVEDLDGLNIAAEFGRPDEGSDEPEEDFSEVSVIPPPLSAEDTKDLKLPSTTPRPASPSEWPPVGSSSQVEKSAPVVDTGLHFEGIEIRGVKLRGGRLENERVWEILPAANREAFRGLCILDVEGETRSFLINDGDVLESTTTNQKKDLLSFMVRERVLSDESATMVRREMSIAEGVRFRDALLKRRLVRLPEMNRLERLHHEILVAEAVAWSTGTWRIEPISAIHNLPDAPIETPLMAILLSGLMESVDVVQIRRTLTQDSLPTPADTAPVSMENLISVLDGEKCRLVRLLDGTRRIGDAFGEVALSDEEKALTVAALVVLGFYTVKNAPPKIDAEPPPPKAPSPLTLEETLARKLAKVENGTYFEILELSPRAGDLEAAEARQRLKAEFNLGRFWDAGIHGREQDIALVRKMLDEAYEVLRESARREKYRRAAYDEHHES